MGMFWRKDMVVCDEMDHCNKDLIYCCISQYVPPLHTFRSIASHNAYIINTKKFEIFTRFVQYENERTHHTQFVCLISFVCCLKTI